jgi:Uma2 family endonuclease
MTSLAHIDDPMTVEEFLGFAEARPDEERWELIEGEPILNAAPAYLHQRIVRNLIVSLAAVERERKAGWDVIPGIGVRLSDISAPVPDVMVRPRDLLQGAVCDDMIVAFEVLCPSTARRDLRWKRKAYAGLPSLRHYAVIAQDKAEVLLYDRASGFVEQRLCEMGARLELEAIDVALPLAAIYENTRIST